MTSDGSGEHVPCFSSGGPSLDLALGIGGYPRGRVIEIYGPESSGKTTLTLHAIAEVQRSGGVAAFIDAEHALDVNYARKLGVNIEDLLVSQPDTGEQALEIADVLLRSGAIDLVVVDSVAALCLGIVAAASPDGLRFGEEGGLPWSLLLELEGVEYLVKHALEFDELFAHQQDLDHVQPV